MLTSHVKLVLRECFLLMKEATIFLQQINDKIVVAYPSVKSQEVRVEKQTSHVKLALTGCSSNTKKMTNVMFSRQIPKKIKN